MNIAAYDRKLLVNTLQCLWKTDFMYRNDIAKNLPIFKSDIYFSTNDVANKGIFSPVPWLLDLEPLEEIYQVKVKNY